MAHNHSHGHSHSHGEPSYSTAFIVGIALNLAFVGVEAAYGVWSHSLALLADAGHNLSDVLGLVLGLVAITLSRRKPSPRLTYGLKSSSILAALGNALLLLIGVGAMSWEAVGRFGRPEPIAGTTVMVVAAIGIAVNGGTALLFMAGRKGDLNVRGAFQHMAADALVSLGVVVGAFVMGLTGWTWIDPVLTLVIALVITVGAWDLFKQSLGLAMQAVPEGVDPEAVKRYLQGLPEVCGVHDLHIWGMSTSEAALTVHLVRRNLDGNTDFLVRATKELHDQFHIEHVTIQVEEERPGRVCRLEPDEVV